MKEIFFPGNWRQPCKAQYGITLNTDGVIPEAVIVVYQGQQHMPATSILNADDGCEAILNTALETDLRGVRVEFVRFVIVFESYDQGRLVAREFPIRVDVDDFVARGNRHNVIQKPAEDWRGALLNLVGQGNRKISFWSGDVVGGCARFHLDDENSKGLLQVDAEQLLKAVKRE
ncbi:MAG: hypothetical protein FD131_3154 [Rhodocyclaceae bacterium]|nr:MAG: hypothetical protein FD131_3154 [Rhodocyclaceae bacterium]